MAKGAEAKIDVANRIAKAFGSDWIGEVDKKYYVWGNEGGERVQICIAMTCPKVPVGAVAISSSLKGEINFDEEPVIAPTKFEPAEISQQEIDNVTELMKRLGL